MYILFLMLFLNSFMFCDTIENGWKGIKALKTDKATVYKLLGKPEIDDNGYAGYSTDDAFIEVNFSTAPCENDQYERGKYKVPKETALDYTVRLKKKIKLSEFRYNQEKYEKDTSGDLKSSADYYNPNDEITIGVYIQEGTEYVTDIHFGINKKDAELFKCEEINDLK